MRPQPCSWIHRSVARALLFAALVSAPLPGPALAADQLIPHATASDDAPLVEQAGPPPDPSSGQLIPTAPFVEDPTRQAGGEDDAQRVNERSTDQRNDDGGDRRRK